MLAQAVTSHGWKSGPTPDHLFRLHTAMAGSSGSSSFHRVVPRASGGRTSLSATTVRVRQSSAVIWRGRSRTPPSSDIGVERRSSPPRGSLSPPASFPRWTSNGLPNVRGKWGETHQGKLDTKARCGGSHGGDSSWHCCSELESGCL